MSGRVKKELTFPSNGRLDTITYYPIPNASNLNFAFFHNLHLHQIQVQSILPAANDKAQKASVQIIVLSLSIFPIPK